MRRIKDKKKDNDFITTQIQKRKICRFCKDDKLKIDYKDAKVLKYFVTERGKIIPRRITGNCAKHQRRVALSVRRARNIALLPFTTIGS